MRISDWSSDVCSSDLHHSEHGIQSAARLSHQPAGSAIIVHQTGGLRMNAHLALQCTDAHGIACTKAAVGIHQEFRGEEQADAFHALGRVRQAGKHQMDDVAAEILIAGGNENLRAGDSEGAVSVRRSEEHTSELKS